MHFVEPMLPTLVKAPFSSPAWLFEPKWDGFRAVCYLAEGQAQFVSRRRNDLTKSFPALQSIPQSIKAESAILDGEIVALDKKGAPRFEGLRSSRLSEFTIVYFAFDLMFWNGEDLTQTRLIGRKAKLKGIISKRKNSRLLFTDHVMGEGEKLFAELERRKLEGMVAKRLDSFYVGGRTRDWLKIKTNTGREEMRVRMETWGS